MVSVITKVITLSIYLVIYEEDHRIDFINVSVAAEEMLKLFAVSIYDDNIAECDKMLILNISALTCEVVIGRSNTSNVTIRDDDGI